MNKKTLGLKRILSFTLSLVLVLGILPVSVMADDYSGHWASESIERAIGAGWFAKSETGTYRPNASITRAEFVTMVNKMKGYTETADISAFTDVKPDDWYYGQFQTAVGAGYISGSDNKLNPKKNITRNEAVTIFARISGLDTEADNSAALAGVKDAASIPVWAKPFASAAISVGLIAGSNGNFNGNKNITRAETAVMLERLYDDIRVFGFAGEYSIGSAKSAIIAAADVTLRNTSISGNLTIAEAVGEGAVYLKGVKVGGKLDVRGGGMNSVYIEDSEIAEVIITKDEVRVVFRDGSTAT